MKYALTIASLVLLVFYAPITTAYPVEVPAKATISWVVLSCDSAKTVDLAKGFCQGYIEGVYNTISPWCVPGEVVRQDLEDGIVKELRRLNKEGLGSTPASDAIIGIVQAKYPCG